MKNIVTKCLVMGALAIGMSSTVMAGALEKVRTPHKSQSTKFFPIAFEVTKGEKTATALLLLPKKGDIHGLICFTSAQSNLGDDCSRVTGKISQYEGYNHIELQGFGLKQGRVIHTTALIKFPINDFAQTLTMHTTSTAGPETEIGGLATQYLPKYKNGQFITSTGSAAYQAPSLTPPPYCIHDQQGGMTCFP
jgi:hypothetical protein